MLTDFARAACVVALTNKVRAECVPTLTPPASQGEATPKENAPMLFGFGGGGMRIEMEWAFSFGVLPFGQAASAA